MEIIRQLYFTLQKGLTGMGVRAVMALFVGCAGLYSGTADATPKVCVPAAQGVPYLSGSPDWWTQGADPNINRLAFSFNQDTMRTEDPRWVGALDIGHSLGATDNAEFRTLYTTINQERHLLLSWSSKGMDFNNGNTSVVIGFKSPTGNPLAVRIQVNQSTTMVGSDVLPRAANEGGTTYLSFSAFTKSGANWTSPGGGLPSWVSNRTKVWILPATNNSKAAFTVQMAVPLGASGLNLPGNNLQMWYSVQPSVPLDIGNNVSGLVSYSWPRGNPLDFAYYTTSLGAPHIPDPSTWGEFGIDMQSGCAGVTLAQNNVGVKNTDYPNSRNTISLNVPDTFYALPKNESGQTLDISDVKATFYFANWGSQRGDLTDQSWKQLTANLRDVPVVGNPANPIDPNVAAAPASVAVNKLAQISKDWSLSKADKCRFFVEGQPTQYLANVNSPGFCAGMPAPDVNPHGCMLVKLNSNKLEFLNDSVVRNMDFVKHSRSIRDAEIRLPPRSKGTRDVYLSVDRRNMTSAATEVVVNRKPYIEAVEKLSLKTGLQVFRPEKSKQERLREVLPVLADGRIPNMNYSELAGFFPTYVVHAFHDIGQTVYVDGKRHKLLEQQTSFGYFAWHEGDLQGWADSIQGAKSVRPDLYKVAVPVKTPVKLKITTEAIEQPVIIKPDIPVIRPREILTPEIINRDVVVPGTIPRIMR